VKDTSAYKVVQDYLKVLPGIKEMGKSLSAGKLDGIDTITGVENIGGPTGFSLPILVEQLGRAAHAALHPSKAFTLDKRANGCVMSCYICITPP
jgi:hypothetical protein